MSSSPKQTPGGGLTTMAGDSQERSAGAATAVITPNVPMWLAGYVRRDEPAYRAENDRHAKAVALEDDGTLVVLVSVELHVVPRELREAVTEACRDRLGVAPSSLVLNASNMRWLADEVRNGADDDPRPAGVPDRAAE